MTVLVSAGGLRSQLWCRPDTVGSATRSVLAGTGEPAGRLHVPPGLSAFNPRQPSQRW